MTLPAQITTNLFPDFKNSPIGPFAKIVQELQDTDNSTLENIGFNTTNRKLAQSFQVSSAGDLASIDIHIAKVNSPTDFITVELYSDSAGSPGTLLATGTTISAAALSTTRRYWKSTFFLAPALLTSTTYWIVVGRSGSLDATNRGVWSVNSTAPYANGELKSFNDAVGWESETGDARFKVNVKSSGRYLPCVDKANNKIRMFKSVDGGNTWSEQDSANAPDISTTAETKSISAFQIDNLIAVCRATSTTGFSIFRYNTSSDTWGTSFTSSTSVNLNTNVSGATPLLMSFKFLETNWDYVVAYNGATETVMGNARRRVKVKRRGSSAAWPAAPGYDLVGSPNTPDLTTFPGTAVDHDLRTALMDGNGVWHGFWTQSDDSNLRHRQYNEDQTFSTANLIGSTPLTTSNSAAYSVGQPVNYYRNGEWHIAVPVETSGALKVGRVRAADAATAASWTNTTVLASGAETANSNPAVLVADNEQGGKLFLIYTKTDGKLYYTHDQGNDLWVAEQELHPGTKTVGAISGGVMVDSIGVCYLDTAPATDDLKFDSL